MSPRATRGYLAVHSHPYHPAGPSSAGSRGARLYHDAGMVGPTAKQRALDALGSLPDDATLDEAIERLCFIATVEEGLRESERGDVVSHEEVKKQLPS